MSQTRLPVGGCNLGLLAQYSRHCSSLDRNHRGHRHSSHHSGGADSEDRHCSNHCVEVSLLIHS